MQRWPNLLIVRVIAKGDPICFESFAALQNRRVKIHMTNAFFDENVKVQEGPCLMLFNEGICNLKDRTIVPFNC